MDNLIYKVVSRDQWDAACRLGIFEGAAIDLKDGYIHFSAAEQVVETVDKHFHGQDDLLLIGFEAEQFGAALKWEVSRGDERFPHLYAQLRTDIALSAEPLIMRPDGSHEFPERFC